MESNYMYILFVYISNKDWMIKPLLERNQYRKTTVYVPFDI